MVGPIIVVQAAKTVAKASLVDSIRDGVVDFMVGQAKGLAGKEVSDRIAGLRSDAKLRAQIQKATERAVERWASDYPDRDLVLAVAQNTTFADLPSVQDAIRAVARQPLTPVAAETLREKFNEVLPPQFEVARIERGVAALLELLQDELAGVPALQQAQAVAAAIKTSRSAEHIEALLEQMLAGPTPTAETLESYLTWVIDQHRYLDPRGVMQTVRQVQVLLQDIYVSLVAEEETTLSASDRRLYEHEMEALLDREHLGVEEVEDLRENLLAQYAQVDETRQQGEPLDLAELAREYPKLVILGDPGAGKTTLLRYLALRHAQALRQGKGEIEGLGPTRLPLYLRIAAYAEYGNGRTLSDFMPTNIRGEDDSDESLDELIREKLSAGSCLVLLDGLDEIIKPDQHSEIAAHINSLVRAHQTSGNRFVITSRVAGYRSAPLSGDIMHYRICDMNDEQIRLFLELWCHAVECFQTPDLSPPAQALKAQAEIDSITQAIEDSPGVRTLAANPLLLRTLALIHRTGARLPQRRIELYRLAADTLVRDWQLARGVPEAALVREADATRLLSELAAWLHQEKPAGIAAHGQVRAQLAQVKGRLDGKDPDHPDVLDAVDDFMRRIRQHTGLFVERAPHRYGFMHLTFQEYYAARWLVARPRQAAPRIRARLHRPRWQEPILLAIGFYGMEFPDDVDDLIEEAILGEGLGDPSPYEHILHRDLLFAVRCLGDQDVNAGLCGRLVGELVQCWLDPDQADKYQPLRESIEHNVQALRGSLAEATLIESLIAALKDESADVRGRAAAALSNVTAQAEVVAALLAALKDENADVRDRTASALGNATEQAEVIAALMAALKDESTDVRDRAASVLKDATEQAEVVTALLAALKDESEYVRGHAASALSKATAQAEVVAALMAALKDESEYVRGRTTSALRAATEQAEVVTALLAALKDESGAIRGRAASALRVATAQAKVVAALLSALKDKIEYVRGHAASALKVATAQAEVVTALLAALKDESTYVRSRAASALRAATAQAEVVTALLVALKDESAHVRGSAASALRGATARVEVVAALLAALKDEIEYVRGNAASALSEATAQGEVVSALLAALKDESGAVRGRAAYALKDATLTREGIAALLAALKDESGAVRGIAAYAYALRETTVQAEVVAALQAALKDESGAVRGIAAYALRDATVQAEVVAALLAALKNESGVVRGIAADALKSLARQPASALLPDLPQQLANSLDLPGLDELSVFGSGRPRNALFAALDMLAPPPRMN